MAEGTLTEPEIHSRLCRALGTFSDEDLAELRDEITMLKEQGHRGFKAKAGGVSVSEDLERLAVVREVIGADNDLFNLSGCSFIVAPYHTIQSELVGAIGVIGPTRMNYARIIPMVDYTAKLVSSLFD